MTDPTVLFACTHNAGRSQMAAALLARYADGRIDLRAERPRPIAPDEVAAADIVVTMGCGDACPVFRGVRYLEWELPDPAGLPLEEVRPIRDEIDRRVRTLAAKILG